MKFEVKPCVHSSGKPFKGLYEIKPEVFSDSRGFFLENYNERDFFSAGLTMKFVQENFSHSQRGVLRGMHFQKQNSQGKLIRLASGQVYDVVIDLRNDSETFGLFYGQVLDSQLHNMLYIPRGFAHGFLVLSDFADSVYKCTDYYCSVDEAGILWNDRLIGINWKDYQELDKIELSEKDKKNPLFDKNGFYFDINGKWIGR